MQEHKLLDEEFKLPVGLGVIDSFEKIKTLARILPRYRGIRFVDEGKTDLVARKDDKQIERILTKLKLSAQEVPYKTLITKFWQLIELEAINPNFLLYLIEFCNLHEIRLEDEEKTPLYQSIDALSQFSNQAVHYRIWLNRVFKKDDIAVFAFNSLETLFSKGDSIVGCLFLIPLCRADREKVDAFLKPLINEKSTAKDFLAVDRALTRVLKLYLWSTSSTVFDIRVNILEALKDLDVTVKLLHDISNEWKSFNDVVEFIKSCGDFTALLLWDKIVPWIGTYQNLIQFVTVLDIPRGMFVLLKGLLVPFNENVEATKDEASEALLNITLESFNYNNRQRLECGLYMPTPGNPEGSGHGNSGYLTLVRGRIERGQVEDFSEVFYLLRILDSALQKPKSDFAPDVVAMFPDLCVDLLTSLTQQISKYFESEVENFKRDVLVELKYRLAQMVNVKCLASEQFEMLMRTLRSHLCLFQYCTIVGLENNLFSMKDKAEVENDLLSERIEEMKILSSCENRIMKPNGTKGSNIGN